ncbi:MAG: CHAD domain-containing protein [Coriobacteriia bacterium]
MNKRFIVPGVDARTTLAQAAPALLLAKAEPLFDLEDAARGGADADAVHDMRVASRRLREAMRLLGPLYPPKAFGTWYKRVRRITRALGPVRDSDVFIEDFTKLGNHVGAEGKRAVAFMVGYRTGRREHELDVLDAELAGLDLAENRRSFESFARRLADPASAGEPLAGFAYGAVAERAATVFGAQPAALVSEHVTRQHELRIDYKRLRYAVEAFAPCYGDSFDDLHETLTAFQDTLGDLHDMHVFLEMLRAPERIEAAARAGVSADALAEVEALLEERAHADFERFVGLVSAHPAEALLPELLLPLARVPEPEMPPVEPITAGVSEELAVAAPVVVGEEPWAEGWDAAETVVDTAPVVDPGDIPV